MKKYIIIDGKGIFQIGKVTIRGDRYRFNQKLDSQLVIRIVPLF